MFGIKYSINSRKFVFILKYLDILDILVWWDILGFSLGVFV